MINWLRRINFCVFGFVEGGEFFWWILFTFCSFDLKKDMNASRHWRQFQRIFLSFVLVERKNQKYFEKKFCAIFIFPFNTVQDYKQCLSSSNFTKFIRQMARLSTEQNRIIIYLKIKIDNCARIYSKLILSKKEKKMKLDQTHTHTHIHKTYIH